MIQLFSGKRRKTKPNKTLGITMHMKHCINNWFISSRGKTKHPPLGEINILRVGLEWLTQLTGQKSGPRFSNQSIITKLYTEETWFENRFQKEKLFTILKKLYRETSLLGSIRAYIMFTNPNILVYKMTRNNNSSSNLRTELRIELSWQFVCHHVSFSSITQVWLFL